MFGMHMSLLVDKLVTDLSLRLIVWSLSRKISLYFPKTLQPAFILTETSRFVLFSIAIVCPRYLLLVSSL